MNNSEDYETLTLKIPKALADFLRAAKAFSRTDAEIEESCSEHFTCHMMSLLESNPLEDVFPEFQKQSLFEAYKLDQIYAKAEKGPA